MQRELLCVACSSKSAMVSTAGVQRNFLDVKNQLIDFALNQILHKPH